MSSWKDHLATAAWTIAAAVLTAVATALAVNYFQAVTRVQP